jgi:uncharacterized protein (DUF302 family)
VFAVAKTGGSSVSYCFVSRLQTPFDQAVEDVTGALKDAGFGVLTAIDVKDTLHRKLDVDFPRYRILGACNPRMAYQALQKEPRIGAMLPCNVIVRELEDGQVEVAAVDPVASMQAVENPELGAIAGEVRSMLQEVVRSLS